MTTLCKACGETYEDNDVDRPVLCTGCGALICEICEVMRCDEGRHDCPLCGTSLGGCVPAKLDSSTTLDAMLVRAGKASR